MKLRIQNKAKGQRGVYVAGELVFVDAGAVRTLDGFTEAESLAVEADKDFRVQSEQDGKWVDLAVDDIPETRQWLAVATDSKGNGYRLIELKDGEWFVGTALASDKPDTASGFDWAKIGAEESPVVLTEEAAIATGEFDPVAYLNTAAKNLDFTDKSQEMLTLLLETEKANKDRSGVIATIEELLTEPKLQRIEIDASGGIDPETIKKALEK